MRHLKKGRKLNRKRDHRNAMFKNMLESFFQYERIQTTAAKARELRSLSEKMITRAKQNTLHSKRIVLKRLHNRDIVAKLFDDIAPRYQDVHGGYTRILKVGRRHGDGAHLSLLELVDVEEAAEMKKKVKPSAQKKPAKAPASRATDSKAKTADSEKKPEASKKPAKPASQKAKAVSRTSTKPAPKAEQTKTKLQTSKKQAPKSEASASKEKPKASGPKASGPKASGSKTSDAKKTSEGKGSTAKAMPKSAAAKKEASAKAESTKKKKPAPKSKSEKPDAKGSA
jgi:large subunit ribosomal protein L17